MRWLWVTSVALAVGVAAILAASSSPQPSQGLLVAAPAMSASRAAHTATAVADGRVRRGNLTLLASAEIYDSAAGVFSRTGDMLVRRHKHDGVLLRDGQVLVTGGSDEQDDRGQYHSSELFDPKTARFESVPR